MSTAPKTWRISVIIPTLNEAPWLAATLAAIPRHEVAEVIVADGGSHDRTVEIARNYGAATVASLPGRGPQQNVGASLASGEILLFLHADTLLPPGFSRDIATTLAAPGVVAGAFRLAIADQRAGLRVVEFFANLRAGWLGLPYGDQALFLRAADFQALGGYAGIPLFEDAELVRRLKKRGAIRLTASSVRTSARRWQRLGILRTTVRNQLLLLGFLLGVSPLRLARWYRR